MMNFLLPAVAITLMGTVGLRMWYVRWRQRRVAERRRIEAPNSHYSSVGVRQQEDRERWDDIELGTLHPLNADEVMRLLQVVDADGVKSLSRKDRIFLDNMTLPRMGV